MLGVPRVLLVGSTVAPACGGETEDACEAAQRKLDSCSDEIQAAAAGVPSIPLVVTDECTALDQCLSACLGPASCGDMARMLYRVTDPNAPPWPESTIELERCVRVCVED